MSFQIELSAQAKKDLSVLDSVISKRITIKLKEIRASADPMQFAKPLQGNFKGLYRFRIGDYRAIFRKESDGTIVIILIVRIQHRRDVYE